MSAINCPLCYPVWNHAHRPDPLMASVKAIHRAYAHEPEAEAVLIGSVFDIAQARMLVQASRDACADLAAKESAHA